jgi:hypothetical protein
MINWRFRKKKIQQRFFVLSLAGLGYAMIQYNAISFIADIYNLYHPKEVTFFDIFVSAIWGLLPVTFLPLKTSSFAAVAWIYYAFIYLSAAAVGVTVHESLFQYSCYMLFLLVGMLAVYFFSRFPLSIPIVKVSAPRADVILLLILLLLAIYACFLSGFTPNFGVDNVYERRMSARDTAGMSGYILAPLRLLFPVLAIYALAMRQSLVWVFVYLIGALGIFSYDGTKSIILYFMLISIIMLGLKKNNLAVYLLGLIAGLNIMAFIEFKITGSVTLLDYVIRRSFVVPGDLSSIYWQYIPGPSGLKNITFEIGEAYSGNPATNANTNFMMFGWVWGGWLGGFIVAAVAGLLLSVFKCVPNVKYPYLGSLMASASMLIWSEQFLHTSLLSSGVFWLLIAAIVFTLFPDGFKQIGKGILRVKAF